MPSTLPPTLFIANLSNYINFYPYIFPSSLVSTTRVDIWANCHRCRLDLRPGKHQQKTTIVPVITQICTQTRCDATRRSGRQAGQNFRFNAPSNSRGQADDGKSPPVSRLKGRMPHTDTEKQENCNLFARRTVTLTVQGSLD